MLSKTIAKGYDEHLAGWRWEQARHAYALNIVKDSVLAADANSRSQFYWMKLQEIAANDSC